MDNQMAGVAHKPQHEFWQRPLGETSAEVVRPNIRPAPNEICADCATEFLAGASFCHQCGLPRTEVTARAGAVPLEEAYGRIRSGLGLSGPALIAFSIGVACILIALVGGAAYSTQAFPDFPAIMLWRMQWLVGATAAFVAGILLKSQAPPK
ncbi:MAG: hypothetical protein ABSE92_12570 [Terriglobales bacterium]|jgi:hypothetical protein